jgi:hypothetical protein
MTTTIISIVFIRVKDGAYTQEIGFKQTVSSNVKLQLHEIAVNTQNKNEENLSIF